jgi:putative DNA primase/helicase
MLQDDLERTCRFLSVHESPDTGEVRTRTVACPKPLPAVILSRAGRLPVPALRGIAEIPLLHADGSIVRDGYDARAQVVVVAPGDWPEPVSNPSEADAREALARVMAIIEGFPHVKDCDRAVTVAAMLSAVLRPTLPACPAFAWSAPVRGSGKSKLADVCAVIATGRTAPAMSWPRQEDEAEKRLAASVMSGDAVILLDNIETALRGDCLNSLLTQPTVSLRVLGKSQMLRVGAAALLLATGNNLILQGDLSRRFLVSHLDPETERPELRQFAFDPVERARTERGALVAALQTIARWGARLPSTLPPVGSFEVWSRRVRDPLVALGMADCCEVLADLHKEDPEREAALEVLTEWYGTFIAQEMTVADVIRRATHIPEKTNKKQREEAISLRDALDAVSGGPGGLNPKRLGKYLTRIKDRMFGDYVMRRGAGNLAAKVATWRVEKIHGVTGYNGVCSYSSSTEDRYRGELETLPADPETPAAGAYRAAAEGDDGVPF